MSLNVAHVSASKKDHLLGGDRRDSVSGNVISSQASSAAEESPISSESSPANSPPLLEQHTPLPAGSGIPADHRKGQPPAGQAGLLGKKSNHNSKNNQDTNSQSEMEYLAFASDPSMTSGMHHPYSLSGMSGADCQNVTCFKNITRNNNCGSR